MKSGKVANGSLLLQRGMFCLDICADLPQKLEFFPTEELNRKETVEMARTMTLRLQIDENQCNYCE